MFTLSRFTDLTNYVLSKMVRAPNETEKRVNIEVNTFFIKKKENVLFQSKYSKQFDFSYQLKMEALFILLITKLF